MNKTAPHTGLKSLLHPDGQEFSPESRFDWLASPNIGDSIEIPRKWEFIMYKRYIIHLLTK